MMKIFKLVFFLIGLIILTWVFHSINLNEIYELTQQISFGLIFVIAIYFLAFLLDTLTWQLTVLSAPLTIKWTYRFFQLRLSGEAFNNILPAGSIGGEPIKAVMLKNIYGFNYREGIASLIISRTINTFSLILFLFIGFILMINSNVLETKYNTIAGVGLFILTLAIVFLFCIQRFKIISHTTASLSKNKLFHWLNNSLHHIREIDSILVTFYRHRIKRTICALFFAFINWVLGTVEIFVTMLLIGHPISLVDAWIIEAIAQLVRTSTFFIPASIGAQEGAFLVIGTAITGSPAIGFTVAIVRRIREIIWIIWGLLVFYVTKPATELAKKDPFNP